MYLYKNNLQNVLDINFDTKEQKTNHLAAVFSTMFGGLIV